MAVFYFMGLYIRPALRMLMADDADDDRFFVLRALQASGVGAFFEGVSDGQGAIDYLRGEPPYDNRNTHPFPNILLLDIKMPVVSGFDVLVWLRDHPDCKVIPTIMFSSSDLESDVHQAYVLGANAYMTKPSDSDELMKMIQLIYNFWSNCHTPAPPKALRCS